MANKVGWIGLGRMGEAMVKRLTQAGHGVDVWTRTRSIAEPLAEYGQTTGTSQLELAAWQAVYTHLSTTARLQKVFCDAGGVVAGKLSRYSGGGKGGPWARG